MKKRVFWAALAATSTCVLAACAGGGGGGGSVAGGGGGSSPPPPPPPYNGVTGGNFTSYSALQPNSVTTLVGISREIAFSENLNTGVTTLSAPSGPLNFSFTQTLNASKVLTGETFGNANRTLSFSTSNGDTIGGFTFAGVPVIGSINNTSGQLNLSIDPFGQGWDYQAFGVWLDETVVGTTGTGSIGAASVGKTTNGDQIPTAGAFTFTGKTIAQYSSPAGDFDFGIAPVTLGADFASRSVTFNSPDLVLLSTGLPVSGTAMTGSLSYASQQNALNGTLTTSRLTGSVQGQFYGPSAQEIGGVYALTPTNGAGNERIIGGFGAKR